MCIHVYTYKYKYKYKYLCIYIYTYEYTYSNMYMYTHIHIYTHTQSNNKLCLSSKINKFSGVWNITYYSETATRLIYTSKKARSLQGLSVCYVLTMYEKHADAELQLWFHLQKTHFDCAVFPHHFNFLFCTVGPSVTSQPCGFHTPFD